MIKINIFSLSSVILVFFTAAIYGQSVTEENFSIPLSKPGQSGKLTVRMQRGAVNVIGFNGNQIEVLVKMKNDDENDRKSSVQGLKKIPNLSRDFHISEEDNQVSIVSGNNSHSDVEIKVPQSFNLYVSTHHDGDVQVENIHSEIEIRAHHGGIVMNDISGSAVANTHHGGIKANFKSVESNVPMAFSTYHGDIDISYPASINASAKIKTTKGDIYTDFEVDFKPGEMVEESKEGQKTKIQIGGWMTGSLGKGGAEIMFSTYHGDIIIRKNK